MNIQFEQNIKDETNTKASQWRKGCHHFILQRTLSEFYRKKVALRKSQIEKSLGVCLPIITDEMLTVLFEHASQLYFNKCSARFEHTGFQSTPSERKFLESFKELTKIYPEFKNTEIYPAGHYTKHLNRKLVVGCHLPDYVIFGLKMTGYSGVIIEIDGDSHTNKLEKDMIAYSHFEDLGLYPLSIPNEKATDLQFIYEATKSMTRKRSGALDKQTQRAKRNLWCKTISCNMTLKDIDAYIFEKFGLNLFLSKEARALVLDTKCPVKIKRELLKELK